MPPDQARANDPGDHDNGVLGPYALRPCHQARTLRARGGALLRSVLAAAAHLGVEELKVRQGLDLFG